MAAHPMTISRCCSRRSQLSSLAPPLYQPVAASWACQCTTLRRAALTSHGIVALPCTLTEQIQDEHLIIHAASRRLLLVHLLALQSSRRGQQHRATITIITFCTAWVHMVVMLASNGHAALNSWCRHPHSGLLQRRHWHQQQDTALGPACPRSRCRIVSAMLCSPDMPTAGRSLRSFTWRLGQLRAHTSREGGQDRRTSTHSTAPSKGSASCKA